MENLEGVESESLQPGVQERGQSGLPDKRGLSVVPVGLYKLVLVVFPPPSLFFAVCPLARVFLAGSCVFSRQLRFSPSYCVGAAAPHKLFVCLLFILALSF